MLITNRKCGNFEISTLIEVSYYIRDTILKNCVSGVDFTYVYCQLDLNLKLTNSDFNRLLHKLITARYPKRFSQATHDYFYCRGYSIEHTVLEISKSQRIRSRRCVEHYTSKGVSLEEAIESVITFQKKCSKIGNRKKTPEYWISLGYSFECASSAAVLATREGSSRCVEYWTKRGHTLDDAKLNISKLCDTSSLSTFISRYGEDVGRQSYLENNNKKAVFGEKNGQFGKPAPKGSGRGISGYYKQYYFRSTYEYFAIKKFEEENTPFIELDVRNAPIVVSLSAGRTYRPDFLINNTTIIEVKPSGLLLNDDVKLKQICCIEQYPQYDYLFLTERDLNIDYTKMEQDVLLGNIKIDYGKIDRYNRIILGKNEIN